MTSPLSRKTLLKSMGSNVESISSLSSFRDPTKPRPYGQLLPSGVEYAPPGNLTIQEVLPHILDKRDLKNTIVLLKDLADPNRPSFLITTLRSRFFPQGNWCAELYHARYPDPTDYRLKGSLTVSIEPAQIPDWLTWRFLSRQLRAREPMTTHRKLFVPPGLKYNPAYTTIVPFCREVRQHSRLGISESGSKVPRGFTPTGKSLQRQELTLTGSDGGKLSGMRQGRGVLASAYAERPCKRLPSGLRLASWRGTGALLPLALT
jgi:hypothetical protein